MLSGHTGSLQGTAFSQDPCACTISEQVMWVELFMPTIHMDNI